ncbi:oxygen carrier activity [Pristimantis euphronides]
MTLTTSERAHIQGLWAKIAPQVNDLGAEALERMFLSFPQTKTYFPHFDLSHGSSDLKSHGGKVLAGLGNAASHLDDLHGNLGSLSDLHAYNLRVDPGNFRLLRKNILVTLFIHFPDKMDCLTHQAVDKFLAAVACALTSKYR